MPITKSDIAIGTLTEATNRFSSSQVIEGGLIILLVRAVVYALLDISEEIHNLANEITPNH